MKRIPLFCATALVVLGLGCASEPGARNPASVPPNRCPFGDQSYPNGERICDHGRELICRDRMRASEPGWWPTGNDCKLGEPAASTS